MCPQNEVLGVGTAIASVWQHTFQPDPKDWRFGRKKAQLCEEQARWRMAEVMPKKMNWQREHAQKFSRDKPEIIVGAQEVGVLRVYVGSTEYGLPDDLGLPRAGLCLRIWFEGTR